MKSSFILKIFIGLVMGVLLGLFFPHLTFIGFLGDIFVNALRSIAPILVFVLIASSISNAKTGIGSRFKTIIIFYLIATFLAALVAISFSFIFPVSFHLSGVSTAASPNVVENVISNMFLNIFSNPLKSLSEGNYLSILFWSITFGIALKIVANDTTKDIITNCADAVILIVSWIIQCAPIGIMGLVFTSVSESGFGIFTQYGQLILLLVACMFFIAFIVNPLISGFVLRRNTYSLVLTCLKESGITAFFSRSSAANIPVNLQLCERLGLDRDFYSISIPLGATINMQGSAVTITILSLAVCHTLGLNVSFVLAIVLCIISSLAACGSSGVAGGSLLLIPFACSLFGISSDISMQAVSVGFIIGIIQDSCETAINSSADVLFSATTEYYHRRKNNLEINYMGEFK